MSARESRRNPSAQPGLRATRCRVGSPAAARPLAVGARASAPASRGSSFPCQRCSNCTEGSPKGPCTPRRAVVLAAHHRKAAAALGWNVFDLAERHGLAFLGFLTLTFADHVTDPKEAQRRLHSLLTHVLGDRYAAWVRVFERQKSGRIHYHLLVVLREDIRTGVDFAAFGRGDYRTAGAALRAEWAFWRRTAKSYGFGRTELLPIRSTVEAAARYVGKYISKHVAERKTEDKGVRLVAYSRGAAVASTRFAWAESGREWRHRVAQLVEQLGPAGQAAARERGLGAVLGDKWAFMLALDLARERLLCSNGEGQPVNA